jgi:hypothetical protein
MTMALFQNLFAGQTAQPAAPPLPRVPWAQNPMITTAALSLLGGRNLNDGLANVAATAGQGMAAKSNLQGFMMKRQEEDAAKAAQRAAWNAGMKWKSAGGDWNALAPEDQAALSAAPDIAAQFMPQQAELPTSVREYQYGQQDPAFNDWQMNQKKAGATNVTTTVNGESGADSKLRGKLSEAEGERWSVIQKTGSVAASRSQDFGVMGELLKIAPQGPITGKLAEMFPGFSSAGDAVNAIVYRLAPTLRVEGSGATSDLEYNGMLSSIPSLSKNPLGNQIILETMQAKAQIDMERAAVVTAYQNEEISAAEARNKMAELDRMSILTPRAKALINTSGGVSPGGELTDVPPGLDPAEWGAMTPEERALFQ